MKRFYTFFIVAMLAVTAFAQKTITVNFEHPEHLASIGSWYNSLTLDENNKVTITGNVQVNTTPESYFVEILNGEEEWLTNGTSNNTAYTISYDNVEDGDVLTFKTAENDPTTFHIIGNPEHLYLTRNYGEWSDLENVDGEWTIIDKGHYNYGVGVKSGYQIVDVTSGNPEETPNFQATSWSTPYNYTYGEEYTYTITTQSLDELRNLTATVKVSGDLAKFAMYRNTSRYSDPIALEEGDNAVKFQESESPFRVAPEYGKAIYQVKLNGELVEPSFYGNDYSVAAADGDVIEINADFPDKDVPVKFTFVNEGTEGVVSTFKVNDVVLTPEEYLAEGFTVKMGDNIYANFNSGDYTINSVKINGNVITNYYGDSYYANDNNGYEYEIDAVKKDPYLVRVNCEAWEHVRWTSGYNANDAIPLTSESCLIEVPASAYSVTFYAFDDYNITSMESDTDGFVDSYSISKINFYEYLGIVPGEEYEVTINTKFTDRNQTATFYLEPYTEEEIENGDKYWSTAIRLNFKNYNEYKEIILADGYTTVNFADTDNPVSLSISPAPKFVYINGEVQEDPDGYATAPSEIEIEDGDVVKIFKSGEIENYNVVYDIDEAADVKIFHDQVIEVAEPDKHSVMMGTEIRIVFNEIPETEEYEFKHELVINDETVEFENGEHVLAVNADTNIAIKVNQFTGVENIAAGANAPQDVYNLQGVRIISNASAEQIKALPAGIYVIGGEKRAIR